MVYNMLILTKIIRLIKYCTLKIFNTQVIIFMRICKILILLRFILSIFAAAILFYRRGIDSFQNILNTHDSRLMIAKENREVDKSKHLKLLILINIDPIIKT